MLSVEIQHRIIVRNMIRINRRAARCALIVHFPVASFAVRQRSINGKRPVLPAVAPEAGKMRALCLHVRNLLIAKSETPKCGFVSRS